MIKKGNFNTSMQWMKRIKYLISLATLITFLGLSHVVTGQIPMNDNDRFCFNQLLSEDFGAAIPMGWEGDWMIISPPLTEGWILQSGPSPDAPNTGADGPFSGTHFAYMETNGPAPINSVFKINTPPISLTDVNAVIKFRVLMHGSGIGSLKVNVLSGSGFANSETVLTLTGAQHTSSDVSNWDEAFIDIRQYEKQTIKVEFEGMKMTNNLGDIAIDLVEVCTEPRVPTMGQWGTISLCFLIMIFSVVAFKQQETSVFS